MGFGWLFIGYFMTFLMSVNTFGFIFRLLGYLIILFSALKLREYNRAFVSVCWSSAALIASSAVTTVYRGGRLFYDYLLVGSVAENAGFETVMLAVDTVLVLAFHICLTAAVRSIAIETGVIKIAVSAVRNFAFFVLYYTANLVANMPFEFAERISHYINLPLLLLYFACIVLELILIFTCYAKICAEGDEYMPQKKSRFEFVNRMREEREERERKSAEAAAEFAENKREKKKRKGK